MFDPKDLVRSQRIQYIQRWTKKAEEMDQNEIFENLRALKDKNRIQIVKSARSPNIMWLCHRQESPNISSNGRNLINFVQQGPSY